MKNKTWLKKILEAKKMTQKQLADKAGISLNAVSKIIRGERYGSDETWGKITKALENDCEIVSYECTQIIDDIKTAIAFKNKNDDCYLIYKKIDGYIVFIDFELDDDFELDQDEFKIKTTLKDALQIFESQNKTI